MRRNELKWMICSPGFLMAVITIYVLCFVSPIFIAENGMEYSIIDLLQTAKTSKSDLFPMQYAMVDVLQNAIGGYLPLFAPVVTSLPLMLVVYSEKRSEYKRSYIFRKKTEYHYVLDKLFVGFFVGGVAVLSAMMLFQITILLSNTTIWHGVLPLAEFSHEEVADLAKFYFGAMFYGGMSMLLGGILCFLFRNIYIIVCIPFLFTYMYDLTISHFNALACKGNQSSISGLLFSYSFTGILWDWPSFLMLLGRAIATIVISVTVLMLYQKNKFDVGE